MMIKERLAAKIPAWRERIQNLSKGHGHVRIDTVTVEQILGGMRGVKGLVTDISYVDPYEGILLRGYSIPKILGMLPKPKDAEYPLAGGLFYLLMVGDLPTLDDAMVVEEDWMNRSSLPAYIMDVLNVMPRDTHPMTMFSQAILAMQKESVFAKKYENGIPKVDYWEYYLEDCINLTAKLPTLAAFIYNLKFKDGQYIPPDKQLDWSANFAHMIGKGDGQEYKELSRLFFILHSDHESANVSAHTAYLVSSALSDVYLACSAAMNGLAGPLHGLANQGCLRWLLAVREKFGGLPTREQMEEYTWNTLNSGKVIPGYGHAVLRRTDPRFISQLKFGKKYMPDDELFQLVNLVYEVVPRVLAELGKVNNPWPNVDAVTGALQYHYGIVESEIYTVLFGVSRILGISSNLVWARALGMPIERPQSLTTSMVEDIVYSS